jgi:hypothetical protein
VNAQSLYIPVRNQERILGYLEVGKTEPNSDYVMGLESPEIVIQESEL